MQVLQKIRDARFLSQIGYSYSTIAALVGSAVVSKALGPQQDRSRSDPFAVAFRLSGGIGDHVISARYLRDLQDSAGPFVFDVFSSRPDVARWLLKGIPGFRDVYDEYFSWPTSFQSYSLAMWVIQFAFIMNSQANWKAVNRGQPKLTKVCEACERFRPKIAPMIDNHPRLDGALGQAAVYRGLNRYSLLHTMSGISYGGHEIPLSSDPGALMKFGLTPGRYVTIHNGFDAEFIMGSNLAKRSTKVYPHFAAVAAVMERTFPDLMVVQIGTKTSQPIPGASLNLIGSTTLAETVELLRHSRLHIDNESGLVHIAASLGTRSCVIFGPTPADYFAYDENVNVRPPFCGGCWWSTEDWMVNCPRGFDHPKCLYDMPPEVVFDAIRKAVADAGRRGYGETSAPLIIGDNA
jgi:hypothetical protein